MKKELNFQCLYRVILDSDTFIYSFTTKNHIQYNIAFADSVSVFQGTSTELDIIKVHSLTIVKMSKVKEQLDINVQRTIDCIIKHFFNDRENSIIYLCDSSDKKELKRLNKFNSWYEKSSFKNEIIKIDEAIPSIDTIHYTSLMYHIENPFQNSLKQGYYDIIEELKK